ncbi:hypothetical protein RY831_23155 [Noviherbaspirillum sp. CPCC 100848]|uniref:Transposase n=1 Tax=Noviherbaspirillum album TaxID=3080276 RepID=A0ABU6JEH7_9BURK|nr:hypothetical protein [Noviherbaspirillum sp. CPCC 100848]MEC4722071.1 hypothetical protein [Noviherbaspirillum sp. CPCC 100848]
MSRAAGLQISTPQERKKSFGAIRVPAMQLHLGKLNHVATGFQGAMKLENAFGAGKTITLRCIRCRRATLCVNLLSGPVLMRIHAFSFHYPLTEAYP